MAAAHGEEDEFLGILDGEEASRRVKMAVLAPMPRARVSTAIVVKPGVRARVRRAYLKSRNAVSSEAMVFISRGLSFRESLPSNCKYALSPELFPEKGPLRTVRFTPLISIS